MRILRKKSLFNRKLQSNFIEIALWHGYSSVNLLHIFRTLFYKNTSEWLLLSKTNGQHTQPWYLSDKIDLKTWCKHISFHLVYIILGKTLTNSTKITYLRFKHLHEMNYCYIQHFLYIIKKQVSEIDENNKAIRIHVN